MKNFKRVLASILLVAMVVTMMPLTALASDGQVGPALTELSTVRTGSQTATVKFTSDKAGTSYCYEVEKDTDATIIDTVVAETEMVVGKNTISVTDLTSASAKDIYVVAKDTDGNISKVETTISAYLQLCDLTAKRTGSANATVEFTANKTGTYYFAVTEKDATAPTIDTASVGAEMVSGKNTITLTNLNSNDEKKIHIIAKNQNGNAMSEAVSVLIPKYSSEQPKPPVDEYSDVRAQAKKQLSDAYAKCDQSDYTSENYNKLKSAYQDGIKNIDNAKPSSKLASEIYDALNKALAKMDEVPSNTSKTVTVCVSMDANTLGLGYIIKPTLVTVNKYEKASIVITDMLKENGYKFDNTGSIESSFYLSGVNPVNQKNAVIPDFILSEAVDDPIRFDDKDNDDLAEFDYYQTSGWMYSVGSSSKKPTFPGVGASGYKMTDGEVMRWQFTVYGLGADLNADNSAWGGNSIVPKLGNKTELTWAVAKLRKDYSDEKLEANATYKKAIEVLTSPKATQSEIDKAKSELSKVNFKASTEVATGGSAGGGKTENKVTETVKPNATVSGKTATASITKSEADKALEAIKKSKANEFVINPEIKGDVDKVVVKLPKATILDLKTNTDAAVSVKSDVAEIIISNKALESITGEAGTTVSIAAEKMDNSKLSEENKKLVGNRPVFDFKIDVDGKSVKNFSEKITVSLPYTLAKNEDTEKLTVYYIDENGKATEMNGAYYDSKTKSVIFKTNHFSTFAIVYDESKITFEDVKPDDWFASAVRFVIGKGLLKGTSEKRFGSNDNMTRSMLVTALYRMEGNPSVPASSVFKDVQKDTWYSDSVNWVASNKIVSGYSNGKFGTNDNITREQLAAILYRFAQTKGYSIKASADLNAYTDKSKTADWAIEPMKWATANKIISGRSDTILAPKDTATRAEVATILMRFMENNSK